jgi:hypothetical protein
MSRVIDHTPLAELAAGGQYLAAATAHYGKRHRIIVVPMPAVSVAIATAAGSAEKLGWYLGLSSVVKIADFGLDDAIATGQHRPALLKAAADPGEWFLTAAVVHTARALQLPILTHEPGRYDGHDVQVTRLP